MENYSAIKRISYHLQQYEWTLVPHIKWNNSEKDKHHMISLILRKETTRLIDNGLMAARDRAWNEGGQVAQTSCYKISPGKVIYSMVTIVNNTVLYILKLLKAFTTRKKNCICELVMGVDYLTMAETTGDHFTVHACIESLCCTFEVSICQLYAHF